MSERSDLRGLIRRASLTLNSLTGPLSVANGGTGLTGGTSGGILGFTGPTTLASSAALAANGVVIGGGAGATPTATAAGINNQFFRGNTGLAPAFGTATLASADFANQGTSTTVLHGNAAGNPSWGQISLTADVTGDLPYANLAQGSALSVLGVAGNATADVASIAAGSDYQVLRRSGLTLGFGAVDLSQAAAVTNQLPLTAGGTNASLTASNGGIVYSTATALAILAGTATAGQIPRSGASAAPTWSTATYPATITANAIPYASATNVIGESASLTFDGSTLTAPTIVATTASNPDANDGATLGTSLLGWSDLFLASGGLLNWAAGDAVITHSSGVLNVTTGDLRVTTAGANAQSVVTVGGAQTLTSKTLTSPTIGTSPTAAGATWTDLGSVTTADINGGTIDGVTIGGGSAGAITGTTVTATSTLTGQALLDISGASAGQIKFPATQNASSDANTLDDYEEGTFTPAIAGDSTAGSQTYSVQAGFYTKIGNRVFWNCRIVMTAKDGATAGNLTITGLPFTSNATSHNFHPAAIANAGNIDLSAGYSQITVEIQPGGAVAYLGEAGDNVASALLQAAALQATTRIAVSGSYVI